MSSLDHFLIKWDHKIKSITYELLKLLEIDCIMCDWKFELDGRRIHAETRIELYIELVKSENVYNRIINISGTETYMLLGSVENSKPLYDGSLEKCIEYFKKNILYKNEN